MHKPLKLSWPVIDRVERFSLQSSGRAILLEMRAIEPASLSEVLTGPTHCRVVALLENGKAIQMVIPVAEWNAAKARPVPFTEDRSSIPAPSGVLYDCAGRVFHVAKE